MDSALEIPKNVEQFNAQNAVLFEAKEVKKGKERLVQAQSCWQQLPER